MWFSTFSGPQEHQPYRRRQPDHRAGIPVHVQYAVRSVGHLVVPGLRWISADHNLRALCCSLLLVSTSTILWCRYWHTIVCHQTFSELTDEFSQHCCDLKLTISYFCDTAVTVLRSGVCAWVPLSRPAVALSTQCPSWSCTSSTTPTPSTMISPLSVWPTLPYTPTASSPLASPAALTIFLTTPSSPPSDGEQPR